MVSKLRTMLDRRTISGSELPGSALLVKASGQGDRRVIHVSGELDIASRDELFNFCTAGTHKAISIDLGGLTFMDCGGYSSLVRIRRSALSNDRTVTIRNPAGQPLNLLGLIADLSDYSRS
ncbi:MAG: STAS domain-containing protein [Ilumatobacteraceae bacterium]